MTATALRSQIRLHGTLLFVLTGCLTLAAVVVASRGGAYVPSEPVSIPYFLAVFFIGTLLLLLALRVTKGGAVFEALFTIAMLSGAWFLADIFIPGPLALVVGSAVILARFVWKRVAVLNAAMAVGIAGISAAIAADLTVTTVLVVLAVLAFYDILAVYATKHMVKMFRGLADRGAVFAFMLTPLTGEALAAPTVAASGASEGPTALYLGTGDVALPMMLAASAMRQSDAGGIAVLLGAIAGFWLMTALFFRQGRRRPMPALPPIALGAAAFYLISLLIFPA